MTPTAEHFDGWYRKITTSPAHRALQQSPLGLPEELLSSGLVPWDGVADIVRALQLAAGDVLVDLGCGQGGYGLEVARRAGTRLVGVDFSAVAVETARQLAAKSWPEIGAEFRVGDLAASGLDEAVADAVMCLDAMQFAQPYSSGVEECFRLLRPGGRLAVTGWQGRADDDIPLRIRTDISGELYAVGFVDIDTQDMPEWRAAERTLWQQASEASAADEAVQSMQAEAEQVLAWLDRTARVLVTASRP